MRKAQHVVVTYHYDRKTGTYIVYLISAFDCKGEEHRWMLMSDDEIEYACRDENVHDMIHSVLLFCKTHDFYIKPFSHDFGCEWYPIDFMNLDDEYPTFNRYGYTPY